MRRFFSRLKHSRVDIEVELAGRRRDSSYPYISGDTFRAFSDVIVDETGVSTENWEGLRSVFCATKYADQLLGLLDNRIRAHAAQSMVLIIHNGDTLPSNDSFAKLLNFFESIHTVNVTNALETLGIKGLPIGLENLHWNNNGKIERYTSRLGVSSFTDTWIRQNLILSSFSTHTNPAVRQLLKDQLASSELPRVQINGNTQTYEDCLSNSVFVLSPQGNGLDCHRTWEALYSGSIPVVTAGTLSEELSSRLPILVTPDWETFLKTTEKDLREVAKTLGGRSLESAFMPYWLRKLGLSVPE